MPKCQTTQEVKPLDVLKQNAIQASRGGGNVNKIINQIWTQLIIQKVILQYKYPFCN